MIVPSYNAGNTLIYALESIRKQTLQPAFVHIIDDQSPSDDAGIASSYVAEHKLQGWYVHRLDENKGAGGARDFGIKNSTTSYIAFLDADDSWVSDHLESAFFIIDSHDLTLFGGQTHKLSHGARVSYSTAVKSITKISFNRLLFKCYFLTSTVILRRLAYLRVGGFLQSQRLSEDYSLWLRIVADLKNRSAVTNAVHALYRDSDTFTTTRLSSNHWAHECAELRNFKHLHRLNMISFNQLLLASGFSFLKYLIRLMKILMSVNSK